MNPASPVRPFTCGRYSVCLRCAVDDARRSATHPTMGGALGRHPAHRSRSATGVSHTTVGK